MRALNMSIARQLTLSIVLCASTLLMTAQAAPPIVLAQSALEPAFRPRPVGEPAYAQERPVEPAKRSEAASRSVGPGHYWIVWLVAGVLISGCLFWYLVQSKKISLERRDAGEISKRGASIGQPVQEQAEFLDHLSADSEEVTRIIMAKQRENITRFESPPYLPEAFSPNAGAPRASDTRQHALDVPRSQLPALIPTDELDPDATMIDLSIRRPADPLPVRQFPGPSVEVLTTAVSPRTIQVPRPSLVASPSGSRQQTIVPTHSPPPRSSAGNEPEEIRSGEMRSVSLALATDDEIEQAFERLSRVVTNTSPTGGQR